MSYCTLINIHLKQLAESNLPAVSQYPFGVLLFHHPITFCKLSILFTRFSLFLSSSSQSDRDAVMWLNALDASTDHVFFGTNKKKATDATPKSAKKITNNGNVHYLSRLEPRKTYYWRVDAVINEKTIYKGNVCSFTTK